MRNLKYIATDLRSLARPLRELREDPENARTHSEANINALVASLRKFGQRKPVVAYPDGRLIAGSGTLVAARALGWSHLAVAAWDGDETSAKAYAIADNRTGELAAWDVEALDRSLADLKEAGWDLDVDLGFTDRDLSKLLEDIDAPLSRPRAVEPDAPEEPVTPITKRGDLWLIGEHRLLCSDSTDAASVAAVLAADAPIGMVLDPPFDFKYDAWSIPESVQRLMVWVRGHTGLQFVGGRVGDSWGVYTLAFSGQARGWARPAMPCLIHEVVYCLQRGRTHRMRPEPAIAYGLRLTEDDRPFSFYEGLASRRNDMSWAKNPACYAPWLCSLDAGAVVYDPLAGAGGSLLACERAGNPWRGIEIQERWVDLAVNRWEQETGKKAERVPAGGGAKRGRSRRPARRRSQSAAPKTA